MPADKSPVAPASAAAVEERFDPEMCAGDRLLAGLSVDQRSAVADERSTVVGERSISGPADSENAARFSLSVYNDDGPSRSVQVGKNKERPPVPGLPLFPADRLGEAKALALPNVDNPCFISEDWTRYYDGPTNTWKELPIGPPFRRVVVSGMLTYVGTVILFTSTTLDLDMFEVHEYIPRGLWERTFTEDKRKAMIDALETKLWRPTVKKITALLWEWSVSDPAYPPFPTTLEEVQHCTSKPQRLAFIQYLTNKLTPRNAQSDAWLIETFSAYGEACAVPFMVKDPKENYQSRQDIVLNFAHRADILTRELFTSAARMITYGGWNGMTLIDLISRLMSDR